MPAIFGDDAPAASRKLREFLLDLFKHTVRIGLQISRNIGGMVVEAVCIRYIDVKGSRPLRRPITSRSGSCAASVSLYRQAGHC